MSMSFVQLHFVRGRINHRLRFGVPAQIKTLDKYRSIAIFKPDSIFGYIRWRANEYGTQDWRVYVAKAQEDGFLSKAHGINPAVNILVSAQGKPVVKRCLKALDDLESQANGGLETVPESYWGVFNNALLLRKTPRGLPRNYQNNGAIHAR